MHHPIQKDSGIHRILALLVNLQKWERFRNVKDYNIRIISWVCSESKSIYALASPGGRVRFLDDRDQKVKNAFYNTILRSVGVDFASSSPSRMNKQTWFKFTGEHV